MVWTFQEHNAATEMECGKDVTILPTHLDSRLCAAMLEIRLTGIFTRSRDCMRRVRLAMTVTIGLFHTDQAQLLATLCL